MAGQFCRWPQGGQQQTAAAAAAVWREVWREREGPHSADQMTSLLQLMFSSAQTQGRRLSLVPQGCCTTSYCGDRGSGVGGACAWRCVFAVREAIRASRERTGCLFGEEGSRAGEVFATDAQFLFLFSFFHSFFLFLFSSPFFIRVFLSFCPSLHTSPLCPLSCGPPLLIPV